MTCIKRKQIRIKDGSNPITYHNDNSHGFEVFFFSISSCDEKQKSRHLSQVGKVTH